MANRYKNIDTTEETEEQMPHTQIQSQPSRKQIRQQPPNHHVKFYFVQKDPQTGRRLSKQILM